MKKKKKETNILYSTDGKGHWIRREWKLQCTHEVFMASQCQGVEGHEGDHWCYRPCGSYNWEHPEGEYDDYEGVAGDIPPGHKSYISPQKMAKHYFMSHYEDTKITDPKLIARLEKDKTPEKNATITRPVSAAMAKKLEKFLPNKGKKNG